MAYKVGTTIVIDDSGFVDWSRLTNTPAIGSGTITRVTVANSSVSSGARIVTGLNTNCYVDGIAGGGTAGEVTVTASVRSFNCNCNCRC